MTPEELEEEALRVLRLILRAYNFEEDEPGEEGKEHDYRIKTTAGDHVLTLDVDADEEIRGVLIGRGCANVAALERILIGALHRRFNLKSGEKLGRAIRLSVDGTRPPDTGRENGDQRRSGDGDKRRSSGNRPAIIVIVPPGVDVITRPGRS